MKRLKAVNATMIRALAVVAVGALMVAGGSGAYASEDPNATSQEVVATEAAPTNDVTPAQEQPAPAPVANPEPAPAPAPQPAPEPEQAPAPAPEPAPAPANPVVNEESSTPAAEEEVVAEQVAAPNTEESETPPEPVPDDSESTVYNPPAPTFRLLTPCDSMEPMVEVTVPEYDRSKGQYRIFAELVEGPGVYLAPGSMTRVGFEPVPGVDLPPEWVVWTFDVENECANNPDPEADFVLVLWKVVDSDGSGDIWEQNVAATLKTNSTDLSQLDGAATQCGTYQVDLYDNSEATASLIAGGVLYGPGNPYEDFADIDGPTHKVFTVDDCEVTVPSGAVPTFTDVCGTAGDGYTVPPKGTGYSFVTNDQRVDGVGLVSIDLVADEGYELPEGIVTHWEHEFTNEPCPLTEIAVPGMPSFTDPCGPDNIRWTQPVADTDEVKWVENEDGSRTVTPKPGYMFKGESQSVTYDLPKDSNTACPVETPKPSTPPTPPAPPSDGGGSTNTSTPDNLATTGGEIQLGAVMAAVPLLLAGLYLVRRRRQAA